MRYPFGAFAVLEYNVIVSAVLPGRPWSSVSGPFLRLTYLQYIESPAARELFEFQVQTRSRVFGQVDVTDVLCNRILKAKYLKTTFGRSGTF